MPIASQIVMQRTKYDEQSNDVARVDAGKAPNVDIIAIEQIAQHQFQHDWHLPPADRSAHAIMIGQASTLAGPMTLVAAAAMIAFWF